ncbi:MAG: ABC transporter ATP-binding protein [Candidatus Euphemobacter frigidus]|nr:ABC transporter ATP-binding protein [Candidatus Euphemobacter frigidus]MDP8275685.1 ABC transporter ATP-binding protein [Candidatus Euphemobacter frigidus]
MPLLEVINLEKHFGGLTAINRVTFSIQPGQIKAIIGPNGAGKTTLFNVLTGVVPPDGGEIRFRDGDITGWKSHLIASRGIARTFQIIKIFGDMTVLENVMTGCHLKSKTGLLSAAFHLLPVWREEREIAEKSIRILREVGLEDRAQARAGNLPLGMQRLLEIGRALASEPSLILLDEPVAGLSGPETRELAHLIRRIRDGGTTVLLVDHDMSLIMDISDEVLVLDYGCKIAEGSPREIQNDEKVIAAYLGEEMD